MITVADRGLRGYGASTRPLRKQVMNLAWGVRYRANTIFNFGRGLVDAVVLAQVSRPAFNFKHFCPSPCDFVMGEEAPSMRPVAESLATQFAHEAAELRLVFNWNLVVNDHHGGGILTKVAGR